MRSRKKLEFNWDVLWSREVTRVIQSKTLTLGA